MNRFIITAFALVAMVGCNKSDEQIVSDDSLVAKFASSEIGTRASGNSWEDDDRVGISMSMTSDATILMYENVEYSTDDSGNFTEQESFIYYPASGKVNFYAYYPYQADMSDNIYLADISDQSDIGAIDFMSASLEGVAKSETVQKFTFDHRMAMIKLDLTPKLTTLTLEGTEVEIQGLNTTASFNALTGEIIDGTAGNPIASIKMDVVEDAANIDGNVESLTATLIVLPEVMGKDVKVVFTIPDGDQVDVVSASLSGEKFLSGTIKSYNAEVGSNEIKLLGGTLEPWAVQEKGELPSQETTLTSAFFKGYWIMNSKDGVELDTSEAVSYQFDSSNQYYYYITSSQIPDEGYRYSISQNILKLEDKSLEVSANSADDISWSVLGGDEVIYGSYRTEDFSKELMSSLMYDEDCESYYRELCSTYVDDAGLTQFSNTVIRLYDDGDCINYYFNEGNCMERYHGKYTILGGMIRIDWDVVEAEYDDEYKLSAEYETGGVWLIESIADGTAIAEDPNTSEDTDNYLNLRRVAGGVTTSIRLLVVDAAIKH